jgi:hypothetical protein
MVSAEEARRELHDMVDLASASPLTPSQMSRYRYLVRKSVSDFPLMQLWVLTSSYASDQWTMRKKQAFNLQLRLLAQVSPSTIHVIYRGTHFPWVHRGLHDIESDAEVAELVTRALHDFDRGKPVVLRNGPLSWTKSLAVARTFADEAVGLQMFENGQKLAKGFVHVIKQAHVCGVDVHAALLRERRYVPCTEYGHDELAVAKREQEVLLVPGTKLVPVRRRLHTLEWALQ